MVTFVLAATYKTILYTLGLAIAILNTSNKSNPINSLDYELPFKKKLFKLSTKV